METCASMRKILVLALCLDFQVSYDLEGMRRDAAEIDCGYVHRWRTVVAGEVENVVECIVCGKRMVCRVAK